MRLLFGIVLALVAGNALSQDGDVAPESVAVFPETRSEDSIVPIPVLYYTPETEIAGGAALVYRYGKEGSPASSLMPILVYTQRHQQMYDLKSSHYFGTGEWHTDLNYRGVVYPDKFFGVGIDTLPEDEEPYAVRSHFVLLNVERRLAPNLYAGLAARYYVYRVTESEARLEALDMPGTDGARSQGAGVRVLYDSRDNAFSSRSGSFHELTMVRYLPELGSDHAFTLSELALRRYFGLTGEDVLAFELAYQGRHGEVPFGELAKLGGPRNMRGYFHGRYQGLNTLSCQGEYRRQIIPILWVAGFAGAGTVAETRSRLLEERYIFSGGGGLRVIADERARTTIRIDYGAGKDQRGLYFAINEAF